MKSSFALNVTYTAVARRKGKILWKEKVRNLVVNEGIDDVLTAYFVGGTITVDLKMGLKGTGAISPTDTIASHSGWTEVTEYDEGSRQTITLGSISSHSFNNNASPIIFTINANVTVAGAFVTNGAKMFGAKDFASEHAMVDNDTITLTVAFSAASA